MTKTMMLFTCLFVVVFVLTHRVMCDPIDDDAIAKHSKASPWPMPASMNTARDSQLVDAMLFHFRATTHSCDILETAFIRYINIIFHGKPGGWNTNLGKLKKHSSQQLLFKPKISNDGLMYLDVAVQNECQKWPTLEMDESCELTVFV